MQVSDDLYLGAAKITVPPDNANPSPMVDGVGPLGRVYVWDVVPLTLQASGLAVAQAVATAKNLTLAAGTGVVASVDAMGVPRYVLDCARCVTVVSSDAGDTTQTALVSGYDIYNQPMTSRVSLNGVTPAVTTKAFKSVVSIAVSAATAGNVNAGFNDRLGLPFRVTNVAYVGSVKWNATLAADAGTFVAAVTTNPATALTGDVRGLYTPSSAADGAKRLVALIGLPALAVGPQATRIGAAGVDQV